MRQRLPNRRMAVTEHIEAGGQTCVATVGFDGLGQPREIFMTAGREGSAIDHLLADAAVIVSVALQHGVPAEALARSVGRLPAGPVAPSDLDSSKATVPASPIGAALDLLRSAKG